MRDRLASVFADRTVFAQARRFFGGRLRFGVSGAAAFPEPVARFYDGIGIPVLEGYGMTETCSTVTIEHLDRDRIGTVGRPLAGLNVRLAPDGEVLVRGATLMRGYHNDPAATAAVLVDGWLHTGDTGELEADTLRITGRKREIVVLASGRTVAPLAHESELRTLPLVDNAVVCGDGRPYLTALLSLDGEAVRRWAADAGVSETDLDRLRRHPKVYEAVREMIDELNATRLATDPIRRFAILDALAPESGETTPTWMTRRRFVAEKYRAVIDGLYEAR
jgi:long-chain acyl-CoA synthetase